MLQVFQPTSPKAPCAAPSSTNARKCGLPHTSLASKQNRGPSSHNRSRIATHRTAVPTPYLPYLVYQTFCCPAQSHSQLQLSRATKRITLAAHVWHCVSALLVSFQHPALRQILSAFLLFCRGTSSVSLRQEPSLVRSCMHASCRL